MFFDTSYQAIKVEVIPIPEESHLILQFIVGSSLPGPQGQMGVLPAGAVKIPMGREQAIAKAKEILEVAEALPEPKPESDLVVVGDMSQAEQIGEMDRQVREGAIPGA